MINFDFTIHNIQQVGLTNEEKKKIEKKTKKIKIKIIENSNFSEGKFPEDRSGCWGRNKIKQQKKTN